MSWLAGKHCKSPALPEYPNHYFCLCTFALTYIMNENMDLGQENLLKFYIHCLLFSCSWLQVTLWLLVPLCWAFITPYILLPVSSFLCDDWPLSNSTSIKSESLYKTSICCFWTVPNDAQESLLACGDGFEPS